MNVTPDGKCPYCSRSVVYNCYKDGYEEEEFFACHKCRKYFDVETNADITQRYEVSEDVQEQG